MSAQQPFLKSGSLGWTALATGVIVWDVLAPETLSSAFRRAHTHKASNMAVKISWAILTAHLFGWLPEKADPMRMGVRVVRDLVRHEEHATI